MLKSAVQQMSEADRSKACIDDLKEWIEKIGIDSSNLEELLSKDLQENQGG